MKVVQSTSSPMRVKFTEHLQPVEFRKWKLYRQALRLSKAVADWQENHSPRLGGYESVRIRKKAVYVTKKVANIMVDHNVRSRYNKANQVKDALSELDHLLLRNGAYKDDETLQNLKTDVRKLLNGYFGWLSRQKNKKG